MRPYHLTGEVVSKRILSFLIALFGITIPSCASQEYPTRYDLNAIATDTSLPQVSPEAATLEAYQTGRAIQFPTYTEAAKKTRHYQETQAVLAHTLSLTPVPSLTPTPEGYSEPPTPTQIPTKAILIVYEEVGGGDGGGDVYLDLTTAINEPDLILYSDGQLLTKQDGWFGWFTESWLTESQMCSFLHQLNQAIKIADTADRYNASPLPEYGFGNGEPATQLWIASDSEPLSYSASIFEDKYLSREAARPFQLIEQYRTIQQSEPFISDRVAVWFEHVQRPEEFIAQYGFDVDWPDYPSSYPSLEPWIGESAVGVFLVEGYKALEIQRKFASSPGVGLHHENDKDYILITRPLLPHEGIKHLMNYLSIPFPSSFDQMDIDCSN
jgi:hypothetical protein